LFVEFFERSTRVLQQRILLAIDGEFLELGIDRSQLSGMLVEALF